VGRYYFLGLLVLVFMFNYMDRVAIGIFGQAIQSELRLSDAELGLLSGTAFVLFYVALGLPMGRVADRFSRKWLITASLALWSLMTALSGLAQGFVQLVLARILIGISEAGCTPTGHSLLSDLFPPGKRAMALSLFAAGVPLGTLCGTLWGGWVGGQLGWRAGLISIGLPGVGLAVLIALTTHEPPRGAFDERNSSGQLTGFVATLRTLITDKLFVTVLTGMALSAVALYCLSIFCVSWLMRTFSLPLFQAATLFGLCFGLSGLLGTVAGGSLTDWAGARDARWYAGVPAVGFFMGGVLIMLALVQQTLRPFIILFGAGAVLVNLAVGPSFALVVNRAGARMRASASALILLVCNSIGLGAGPALMGLLSDEFAARSFAITGSYAATCLRGSGSAAGESPLHSACLLASRRGLRDALVLSTGFYLLAALFFFLSARQIQRTHRRLSLGGEYDATTN
jgi:predicted MFS family arabinose efflux permease